MALLGLRGPFIIFKLKFLVFYFFVKIRIYLTRIREKNRVIVGVSAGAVLLGPNIKIVHFFTPQMNTLNTKDFSVLGLTDKLVFPHYGREDLFKDSTGKSIEDRLKEFESLKNVKFVDLKTMNLF